MVDDLEAVPDEVDEPSARPQARWIAGRFRPRDHQTRQLSPLRWRQLGRSTRRRSGAQAGPALRSVRPFPPTHRASVDTEALGHDMNREITLEQVDGPQPPPLKLVRTPLWAHAAPPTVEHSELGHYLHRNH
jgi:hypothetical protein